MPLRLRSVLGRPVLGQRIAWMALVLGLILTLWAGYEARERTLADAQRAFEVRADKVAQAIDNRMLAYEQVLRGGVGLVYSQKVLSREEWRTYVKHLRLESQYPGMQGFGFTAYLRPHEVEDFERRVRASGHPDYRIWPEGDRAVYTAIVYLEPFDWRNQRAFGYDMYSEPRRRTAMAAARDTGQAVATEKVVLVQETSEGMQAGFLMYLPVYRGGGVPETLAERRENLLGFVYGPFRMNDLMAGILGDRVDDLRLEIYDGERTVPERLMYTNHTGTIGGRFAATRAVEVNGRIWTVRMALRSPPLPLQDRESLLVLLSGALLSLLLFGLLWGMGSVQRRAVLLADAMTEAFRRSEAKYSSLAQTALDAIIIVDADGRIVSWNRGADEIFGYQEQEVLGQSWTLVLPQRLRESYQRAFRALVTEPGRGLFGRVLELTGQRRSGEEFPMELSLARWGDDEPSVSGIIRDVSERKRVEEALRLSEQRFRVALKGAEVTVFNQDRELRYTWVYNPPMGFSEREVMGRTDEEVVGDKGLIELKRRVLDSGRPLHERIEIERGGRRYHFVLVLEPVWERGVVVGLNGAAVNITALQRAQQELRASEARFRATFENAAVAVVLSDMDDRILEANPAFLAMLGYSAEEVLGRSIYDFVHPEDREANLGLLVELKRGERLFFKQKKRYQRKDGSIMWGSLSVSLVRDDRGVPTLAIRMIEDVTELHRAEEALERAYHELERRVEERTAELREQARELSRSNAELEQFAYVASHDLQEPLRSVAAFAQLLERRHAEALGEEGRQFVRYIVEGTARMRQLIIDLLAISRVGALNKQFEPVASEEVLETTLANLSGIIAERGARVSHDPLPVVWGERADLLQLFQNLIANGIKFNRNEAPRVHLSASDQGDHWRFSVRDNGIGIDPASFDRIFTIFHRGEGGDEYSGTGIGLAICKKVVERHGGRIWLESSPGEGTVFYFTLGKPPEAAVAAG